MSYSDSGGQEGVDPQASPPWLQFPNAPAHAQQDDSRPLQGHQPADRPTNPHAAAPQPRQTRAAEHAQPGDAPPPMLRPVPPYAHDPGAHGGPQGGEPHRDPQHPMPQPEPGPGAPGGPQQPPADPSRNGWAIGGDPGTSGGSLISPFPPPPGGHPGPGIDEVSLLRKVRRPPSRGWRRAVHTMSGGSINPGDSPADVEYQKLLERVQRPVRGDYRIAVLSLKGGVGKTTTTVGLGSTFATLRGDRVIAVDANPDLGTLAQRVPLQTRSTVRDLLADKNVYRYSDVRAHTSQAPSRLEVLASERDPAMAEAFSEQEYRGVVRILQRFYNIILTDCGTGLSHSAMNGVLDLANAIILVTSPAIDGARSAGATLDWLQAHGYGYLVSNAVVVISSARPGASTIDTTQLGQHFLTRCRAVHRIPFDDHLSEGADVDLDLVGKDSRHALVELAATIADDFATTAAGARSEPFMD